MKMISLLDADPDLGSGVPREQLALAKRNVMAEERRIDAGPWDWSNESEGYVGLLVVEGLLTREVTCAGVDSRELLGAGDVLFPWVADDGVAPLVVDSSWTVLQAARLALLESRVLRLGARWPGLVEALLHRSIHRSRWLAVRLAISSVNRVDRRLLLFFWHAAGRWGRVTSEGTLVPIALTHEDLAALVGARRPSVTTALTKLRDEKLLFRDGDEWLLTEAAFAAAQEQDEA